MKNLLNKEVENLRDRLVEISEYMYHNPELGNEEFKSVQN